MSNEMVADSGVPTPGVAGLSQIERVVDTFVAPSKTFKDILRSASWWLPFLLMVISSVASGYVVDHQVGFDRVYQNQLAQSPKQEDRVNQLPPDQKAHAVSVGAAITKYITYAIPLVLLIALGLYSLIVWAAFNFGLGAKTTFWQVFAVNFYAALPYLLLTILTIVMLYFGGNAEAFDQKNPVGTNPAYYMPDAAPMLKAVLSYLDVVKLWTLVLTILGMAIISKKSITQSAVIIGGLWVLGLVFFGILPAAFS
jgi:hypothetical protein